jgi:tetratricopeptide (TPR) repeat protein
VHYALQLPPDLQQPIEIQVKLQYRKFDQTFMKIVAERLGPDDPRILGQQAVETYRNDLPITTMASDRIVLPVSGGASVPSPPAVEVPAWERWNDYGIGLLLKGTAQLRQASEAFEHVERLGRYDGPLNLARVHFTEGRLDAATGAVRRASLCTDPSAPRWTLAWLSGLINRQQGHLAEAEANFRLVVEGQSQERIGRGFDFSRDYEVINLLGQVLYEQGRALRGQANQAQREKLLGEAVQWFQRTLALDPENVTAHYNLQLLFAALGDGTRSDHHRQLHQKYKPDDNARDRAVAAARKRYPAANHAAEAVVIYELKPPTLR